MSLFLIFFFFVFLNGTKHHKKIKNKSVFFWFVCAWIRFCKINATLHFFFFMQLLFSNPLRVHRVNDWEHLASRLFGFSSLKFIKLTVVFLVRLCLDVFDCRGRQQVSEQLICLFFYNLVYQVNKTPTSHCRGQTDWPKNELEPSQRSL